MARILKSPFPYDEKQMSVSDYLIDGLGRNQEKFLFVSNQKFNIKQIESSNIFILSLLFSSRLIVFQVVNGQAKRYLRNHSIWLLF